MSSPLADPEDEERDAYLCVNTDGVALPWRPTGPEALAFVDIRDQGSLRDLREVPPRHLERVSTFVVRGAPDPAEAKIAFERIVPGAGLYLLRQNLSRKPLLTYVVPRTFEDPLSIVKRCRSVEMKALLRTGRAIWKPKSYHFLLPSGRHSSTFIRTAEAIRSTADAKAIAAWLLPYVEDGTSVVLDSPSILPIAQALDLTMRDQGARLGDIHCLDAYPRTLGATKSTFRRAAGTTGNVLAVISVSSSGSLADLIENTVKSLTGLLSSVRIVSLVDQIPANTTRTNQTGIRDSFCDIEADAPTSDATRCTLCRDASRATLVPIDPDTFEARFPSMVQVRMPHVSGAATNRRLWEACSESDAISMLRKPDTHVRHRRPAKSPMAIHISRESLIGSSTFQSHVVSRLSDLCTATNKNVRNENRYEKADLVLVPKDDFNLTGFPAFKDAVAGMVAETGAPWASYPEEVEWPADLVTLVRRYRRITVLNLGVVSGGTLQAGLTGVQHARDNTDFVLRGLVCHSRPDRWDTWTGLVNSFGFRLEAIFDTVLPDRSPFLEESALLEDADLTGFSALAKDFREVRRAAISSGFASGEPIFWGATTGDRLTAHSIFGSQLTAQATFAAVAASIERSRNELIPAPERLAFNIVRVFQSYYDPLILASVLRLLRPQELWWLPDASAAVAQLHIMLDRSASGRRILLPELLLAAALGRLPASTHDVLVGYARTAVESAQDDTAPIELGLALLGKPRVP